LDIREIKHTTGQGIQGKIGDTDWYIGNHDFILENTDAEFDKSSEKQSRIYLATGENAIATFILSDQVREESRSLIDQLHRQHRHTHLMSGDNIEHASQVSEQLGIQHCQAGLSPADKLAQVKQLQQEDAIVVMTGDGVNDAPVLAGADLSIAMGKGTQLAAAAADMILINNHVIHIYNGYQIARKTLQIIKQNLGWALLYNITAIPAAATGHVEPWLAAIGMSASSLVVVLNALRLNRIRIEQ
jgi:Cu2+-exporting ATPase